MLLLCTRVQKQYRSSEVKCHLKIHISIFLEKCNISLQFLPSHITRLVLFGLVFEFRFLLSFMKSTQSNLVNCFQNLFSRKRIHLQGAWKYICKFLIKIYVHSKINTEWKVQVFSCRNNFENNHLTKFMSRYYSLDENF